MRIFDTLMDIVELDQNWLHVTQYKADTITHSPSTQKWAKSSWNKFLVNKENYNFRQKSYIIWQIILILQSHQFKFIFVKLKVLIPFSCIISYFNNNSKIEYFAKCVCFLYGIKNQTLTSNKMWINKLLVCRGLFSSP